MPEPPRPPGRKTPAQLTADTARTQALLSITGAFLLAVAGAAAGLAVADAIGATPLLGLAGFFAPLGSVAIFFATRRPPEIKPSPRTSTNG